MPAPIELCRTEAAMLQHIQAAKMPQYACSVWPPSTLVAPVTRQCPATRYAPGAEDPTRMGKGVSARRTGTDHLPLTPEALSAAGYSSFDEFDADILQKDALDRSKWEQLFSVPMRYNRLILIQPHFWHTAGPGFGNGVENGRLVYLMFFNRFRRPGPP